MLLVSIILLIQTNGVKFSEILPSKLGPSPRKGSTLAYSEKLSQIFIFGGKNDEFLDDLWTYNLITNTWKALCTSSQVLGINYTEKRIKAIGFYRGIPEEFCIYGGIGKNSVLNDMWCFSLQNYIWIQEYNRNQPPFMDRFSSIHYTDSEYNYIAIAGLDIFTYTLKFFMYAIFRLDVVNFIWEEIPLQLPSMDMEFMLIDFSIVKEKNKIIIPVISLNSTLKTIVEYDVKMKSQNIKAFHFAFNQTGYYNFICGACLPNSIFMVSETGQIVKIVKDSESFDIKNLGSLVTAYSLSSCTCFGYQCYIFAGQSKDGLQNFLNKIDFSSEVTPFQEILAIDYPSPTPRFSHKMEVIHGDFWLFGGTDGTNIFDDLWHYNPRKDAWIEVKKKGQHPTPRHSFSSAVSGDLLVVWGGQDKNSLKNDFFIYNANTDLWAEIPTFSKEIPSKRKNACITVNLPEAYIYGGTDSKGNLSDLWKFNFLNNTYTKIDDLETLEQPVCFKYFSQMMIIGIEKMIEIDFDFMNFEISKISRPADSVIVNLHNFYIAVGGRDRNKALNTVKSIRLNYYREFEIEDYPYMAAGVYYNKTIYIFGGGYITPSFSVLPYLPMPRFIKISIDDFCFNDTCTLRCGVGFGGQSQECNLCPEGFFAYYDYLEHCLKCDAGFYLPNQGGTSYNQCLICPEGTFSDMPGSKYCKMCPADKYCPIGSTSPLPRNQTSKYLPFQPNFLETFTSDSSSKISIFLFLVYLLIFIISLSTKLRNKIKNFDLYYRSHALEEGEYIKVKKSTTGGFFTLLFLFILTLILLYYIYEFLYNNTEVHKTLTPIILIGEDTRPIIFDLKIDFYLKDYYDRCGDSNPKDETSKKEDYCGMFIHSEYTGLKGVIDLHCKKIDGEICHILFKCENCTSEMDSYVQVYSDEKVNAAKGIIVNVTAGSLIPGHKSSSYSEINAQRGKTFSGPVGNNFSFALYPSYYRNSGFFAMSETDFYVLSMHDGLAGSESSVEKYHERMRLIINVHLAQSLNGIFTDYSFKLAPLIIVCIGIGAISALFSLVGVLMNTFEKAVYKRFSIRAVHKEFSIILNKSEELFEVFQGKDYTKYKSSSTERLNENMFLTSGRTNSETC